MPTIFGTLFDPSAEQELLLIRQSLAGAQWGHRRIVTRDTLKQQALLRLARHDRKPAATVCIGGFRQVQTEPSLTVRSVRPVAQEAVLRQDRQNFARKVHLLLDPGRWMRHPGHYGTQREQARTSLNQQSVNALQLKPILPILPTGPKHR